MKTPTSATAKPDAIVQNSGLVVGPENERSILFEIIRTPAGWRVDEDGRLNGEYLEEEQAVTAARAAAMVLINAGGKAEISYGPVCQDKPSGFGPKNR